MYCNNIYLQTFTIIITISGISYSAASV